jgi:CheY-like chemotaxis protein
MTTHRKRILIIDDSEAIHRDFRRVLCPTRKVSSSELDELEDALFGEEPSGRPAAETVYEVDSAFQGQEGVAKVKEAQAEGRPYELVFLDYRMPPGWNGVETLRHLRQVSPSLQVVFCSAYSDYSWQELSQEFGQKQLVELRKPFSSQELRQTALRLTQQSA